VIPPPPPPDPGLMKQKTKLFVGNLPADIQEEAINIVFSHYGTVTNIYIMLARPRAGKPVRLSSIQLPLRQRLLS